MIETLPRISVITPSFNQAKYLETTILSVISQNYPNLEYIIIDGGSTDGSVDIIRKYEKHLSYWVSEPDRGQSDAINKGFRLATGEWVAWQNSDDIYYPGAFDRVAEAARKSSTADLIIADINIIDEVGRVLREQRYAKLSYKALIAEGMILANQAAFWRRKLHDEVGFINEELNCCFDYEWFLRILKETSNVIHIPVIMGALRYHESSKTSCVPSLFQEEFKAILKGREIPAWKLKGYQIARLLQLLKLGHWGYVARGLKRRFLA